MKVKDLIEELRKCKVNCHVLISIEGVVEKAPILCIPDYISGGQKEVVFICGGKLPRNKIIKEVANVKNS